MIRFSDAVVIAFTKLRTRKVRTVVTVVTASILFGALTAAALITQGVVDSTKRFATGGLSERYISQITHFDMSNDPYRAPESVHTRAEELYQKRIVDKKAAAKRLGVPYDAASEPKPLMSDPGMNSRTLDVMNSPAALAAWREYLAAQPTQLDLLKKTLQSYRHTAIFTIDRATIDGAVKPLKNGKENFLATNDPGLNYDGTAQSVDMGWSYIDDSIAEPFLLDDEVLRAQSDQTALPVIAPYAKVEEALGLKKLTGSASLDERLERIKYIRDRAASVRFTVCYRNQASQALIDEAVRVSGEIEANKATKDYQKPSLIYGLPPAESCGPAVVTRDVRTAEEKQAASKELQFKREFGEYVDPVQQLVTFRVVGLTPNGLGTDDFSTVSTLISSLAGSSLNGMWAVPRGMYDAMPNKSDYEKFLPTTLQSATFNVHQFFQPSFLVEFAAADDARTFSEAEGCRGIDCNGSKPFITYFGSNSLLLQDLIRDSAKALAIVLLVVMAVAGLILMGMVGRVIGDSRRETAVFRAIGAKRNDIRIIYLVYTLTLGVLVVCAALVIGVLAALWAESAWSEAATAQALLTFTGADMTQKFHLFGIWWEALAIVAGAVLLSAFTSMLLPLARNLARSPIRDMRDDT